MGFLSSFVIRHSDFVIRHWSFCFRAARILALLALTFTFGPRSSAAGTNQAKAAQLKISGYGVLGNWELKRMIKTVEIGKQKPEFFGPATIEDTALLLSARVQRDGYLKPTITLRLTLADGGKIKAQADELIDKPLPRPLRVVKAQFKVRKGPLFHYRKLEVEGLETLTEKEARAYFIETGTLLKLKTTRIFTPQRLDHSLANLAEVFERAGYEQARVAVADLQRDDNTGAVEARVRVQQGPKSVVHSVQEEFFYEHASTPAETRTVTVQKPYSKLWEQDFTQGIKTNLYHRGYPDTAVEWRVLERKQTNNRVELELLANVKSGPQVHLRDVTFEGEHKTRMSVLERRVRVQEGSLLDRIKIEEGRYRLARLGIFDTVDLDYDDIDEHTRNVTYRLKEGKTLDVSLLFGYGSYELLRGGFEVEQFNIFGRAHHARLKAVQSFKASNGEFTYTMPELIRQDVDVFFNASALRREEIDFVREEYGGGLGVHKYFQPWATDVSLRYNYQILRAVDVSPSAATEGLTNASVGAVIADVRHDRRDNPLYPRKGYKIFGQLELASEYLAGDVNYQRLELWTSWHKPLGGGRLFSVGVSHGVMLSLGSAAEDLPFNRRFFPGGENSIRGYQEGEASPKNELGKIIGAETYSLASVEFEQALTPQWSVVFFSDSIGFARQAADYPWDTGLFSVGGGLRWKTIIGPVRVEYGYNLNPRPKDPSGTIHFSLGFPF